MLFIEVEVIFPFDNSHRRKVMFGRFVLLSQNSFLFAIYKYICSLFIFSMQMTLERIVKDSVVHAIKVILQTIQTLENIREFCYAMDLIIG